MLSRGLLRDCATGCGTDGSFYSTLVSSVKPLIEYQSTLPGPGPGSGSGQWKPKLSPHRTNSTALQLQFVDEESYNPENKIQLSTCTATDKQRDKEKGLKMVIEQIEVSKYSQMLANVVVENCPAVNNSTKIT